MGCRFSRKLVNLIRNFSLLSALVVLRQNVILNRTQEIIVVLNILILYIYEYDFVQD